MIESLQKHKSNKENISEKIPQEDGVFESDGKFFMYSAKLDDFVEIPENVHKTIKLSLWVEERKNRDSKISSTSTNKYNKSTEIIRNTNCHKTAFYTQKENINSSFGVKTNEDNWSSENIEEITNQSEFKSFSDYSNFKNFVKKKLKNNNFGFCQIIINNKSPGVNKGEIMEDVSIEHSFLLGISEKENIIAFEKVGYGFPFQIVSAKDIFDIYNHRAEPDDGFGYSKEISYGIKPYKEIEQDIKDGKYNPTERIYD